VLAVTMVIILEPGNGRLARKTRLARLGPEDYRRLKLAGDLRVAEAVGFDVGEHGAEGLRLAWARLTCSWARNWTVDFGPPGNRRPLSWVEG
jgi:hypothetical protein